jgi:polysaccharide pyruvyl transferase WcaK-like protein
VSRRSSTAVPRQTNGCLVSTVTKIVFFGHFGSTNLGNEATLLGMLSSLRNTVPDAEFACICTVPEKTAADYKITTIPSRAAVVRPWRHDGGFASLLRKLLVGIPSEFYRLIRGFKILRGTDAFIIPGTGLLTDAYTMFNWGPYDLFRWTVTAKLCRCKVMFVSVGAGPIHSRMGRFFVKTALSLADYRSYRDESSRKYLLSIGFSAENDPVCPDLAFSLPELQSPRHEGSQRPVVGIGLMESAGRYGPSSNDAVHARYLATLVDVVEWLLSRNYDVRLLIGDLVDMRVVQEFKSMLAQRELFGSGRVVDEPVESVADLLSQIAATDYVIATRFHNVLLSMLLGKPVIALSFHHKCSSLMDQMGVAEYCQSMNELKTDELIECFRRLRQNASSVQQMLSVRVRACREALEEQYGAILSLICPERQPATSPVAEVRPSPHSSILS